MTSMNFLGTSPRSAPPMQSNQTNVQGSMFIANTQVFQAPTSNVPSCPGKCDQSADANDRTVSRIKNWLFSNGCPGTLAKTIENDPLTDKILNKIDFSDKDCSGVNMKGSSFAGCNFDKTNLSASTLDLCNITNAKNLSEGQLSLCYFSAIMICFEHANDYEQQVNIVKQAMNLYVNQLKQIQNLTKQASQQSSSNLAFLWSKKPQINEAASIILSNPYLEDLVTQAKTPRN